MARNTHTHTQVEPGAPETPEDVNTHIHTHISQEDESASPIILNVYQRMVEAAKIIDGIVFEKTQSNGTKPLANGKKASDGYNSVPIDAMRSAVRKACVEAGLIHVGFIDLEYKLDLRPAAYGGTLYHYEGTAAFRYINADNPSEYVDYFSAGEANDSGDKSLGKMLTNILKSHYKQCWDIGEHGRDDVDSYSNEELEDEAGRIAENAEKRKRNLEAVKTDRFFGGQEDDRVPLRRKIGELMKDHPDVISQYKAKYGLVPDWTKETLEKCIAECEGAKS